MGRGCNSAVCLHPVAAWHNAHVSQLQTARFLYKQLLQRYSNRNDSWHDHSQCSPAVSGSTESRRMQDVHKPLPGLPAVCLPHRSQTASCRKSIAVAKTLAMLHMHCTAVTQVAKEIEAAVQAAVSKQAKKQQAMAAQAAAATDSRQRTELEAAVKNEEHKAKQLQQVQEAFAALVAGEAYAGQQGSYVGHYGTKGFHKCHIHVKHGVAGQLC